MLSLYRTKSVSYICMDINWKKTYPTKLYMFNSTSLKFGKSMTLKPTDCLQHGCASISHSIKRWLKVIPLTSFVGCRYHGFQNWASNLSSTWLCKYLTLNTALAKSYTIKFICWSSIPRPPKLGIHLIHYTVLLIMPVKDIRVSHIPR